MEGLILDLLADPAQRYEAEIDETGGKFALASISVILIKVNDRFSFKDAVRSKLRTNGNYTERNTTFKAGSVDPVEFVLNDATTNHYRLIFKPKSAGGSGAGSAVTDLGEAFQAYILAARQELTKDIRFVSDIVKVNSDVDMNSNCPKVPLKKAFTDTAEDWIHSGEMIANKMFKDKVFSTSSTYEFHHQSPLVDQIYNCFKAGIKTSMPGLRMQADKWNPADIWAFKKSTARHLHTKYVPSRYKELGIAKLNGDILDDFNDKNIIPISLKKFETGTPKGTTLNNGKDFTPGTFEVIGFRNHTPEKFNTQDVFLEFKRTKKNKSAVGEIQFRAFGSGHQGNVTKIGGSSISAVHGKVGVYETFFMHALKQEGILPDNNFIPKSHERDLNTVQKNKNHKFGTNNYYNIATRMAEYMNIEYEHAEELIDNYNGPAFHSSFLGIQLVHYFNKMSKKGQEALLTKFATYAMSQVPDISCVHMKYE